MCLFLWFVCLVMGYAWGNVQTAYILSKGIAKQDIRQLGSGNAGTNNMLRTFGVKMGVATFAGDLFKGYAAVTLGRLIGGEIGSYIAGIGCILGHSYPVVLQFKGGKGIASSLGIILAINPLLGVCLFAAAFGVALLVGYMSVGSLTGVLAFAVSTLFISPGNWPLFGTGIIMLVLAVIAHRENINNLFKGTERRLSVGRFKRRKE